MDEDGAAKQWAEIERVQEDMPGIAILRGMEVDILRDGSLNLDDEYLSQLDIVVIAVHSQMNLGKTEMTDRIIRAMEHPAVDILAHPTGRLINRRPPYDVDVDALLRAAKELDVAVEASASPNRLDLADFHLYRARELGVLVAINTDAHRPYSLGHMRYGIDQARRGWLEKSDVLNTKSLEDLRRWLRRKREAKGTGAAD